MGDDKNTAISKDLVAASATPLILSIVGQGEAYGYQIIKRVRELSGGELEWAEGMLYPVLHRLEDRGLIESTWRVSEEGRRRKYYRLKEAGARELDVQRTHWLLVSETLKKSWEGELCST
jgi:DNA-binding PadR family transcriptional regulator